MGGRGKALPTQDERRFLGYFRSASQTNRRIASGFDGFGSGCLAIQVSKADSKSACTRTPIVRPLPVAGLPTFLFSRSAIAAALNLG